MQTEVKGRLYVVEGAKTGVVVMVDAPSKAKARDFVFDRHFRMRLATRADMVDGLRNGIEVERVPVQAPLPLPEGGDK